MQDWLYHRLTQDYPALRAPELGADAADVLAKGGYILPILDGLDEVGEMVRAEIITALNGSLKYSDQLILTSRSIEFAAAVAAAGRPLTGAAVITPTQLTSQNAARYLRACLPTTPTTPWQKVLSALESHDAPALAELTATPLGLWLVRTVYTAGRADPTPLIETFGRHTRALRVHLLDQLIPALIQTRTPSQDPGDYFRPRHRWDPEATRRYLVTLACIFDPLVTRDIAWWGIPDATHVPLVPNPETYPWGSDMESDIDLAVSVSLMRPEPLDLTPISTPVSSWRSSRAATLRSISTVGLGYMFVGIGAGFAIGLLPEIDPMPELGAIFTFLSIAGYVARTAKRSAWLATSSAARRLAIRQRLPRRIMLFLEDAHRLGLLRAVGPVYQFRHAVLHDHFATAYPDDRWQRPKSNL
ncbi:hypothetical protein HCN51_14255 [Nonomuraea sp. FMUSA5-5]|uniref:Uncharacterized protein n=1 Tax=Nonomuraea composti TaxID=2720023 RepID=A0ABX1B180_9ACTN|nr:hypothetical protein [Nonomuraea sp. FMUSA5-5]NJP90602.1 hypothetical protein [Nonomuraea sp. FMUSA5-5]